MFVEKVGVVAGEFRVVMEDVDELATDMLARGWTDGRTRYALGCLGTDTLQHFALPSQLFWIGLWQCRAGGYGAILRLSCIFVQEAFALRRLHQVSKGQRVP